MPYDNPYNKRVADMVLNDDARYIENLYRQSETPLSLRGGSSAPPVDFNDSFNDRMIQNVLRGGCGCCGGSGFGKMTRMDTGFEKSLGSAEIKNFRPNTNNTGGIKTMEKENPELCDDNMIGSGTEEPKDLKSWNKKYGKLLKLPKITNQLVVNMIKHAQEKYSNDPFYPNLMIMLGRIQSGDREMMNSLENKNLLKRIVKDDLLPVAKAMKKNAPFLKMEAKMKAKDEKAKRGRKSKMGAGLNIQSIPDYQMARPDEAWKLKRDRFMPMKEGSGTKELKDDVNKFDFNRIKDWIGMAKPKDFMALKKHTMMSGKGWEEFKKDLGSFDFNKVKSWIGLGKYGKANSKRMMGSGWWDSFTGFFKNLPNNLNSIVLPIANKINDAVGTVRGAVGLGKNKMGQGSSGGKAKWWDETTIGEGVSGGKAKKAPSAKQLEARRKFSEMVKAKAMMKKNY